MLNNYQGIKFDIASYVNSDRYNASVIMAIDETSSHRYVDVVWNIIDTLINTLEEFDSFWWWFDDIRDSEDYQTYVNTVRKGNDNDIIASDYVKELIDNIVTDDIYNVNIYNDICNIIDAYSNTLIEWKYIEVAII